MNLIQITESLKSPSIPVQKLMEYANNSNPQVPGYVALAEMQRRASMQQQPQQPQGQTLKDQLGAQLSGQQPPEQSGIGQLQMPSQADQAEQGLQQLQQQQQPQQQPQQGQQVQMPAPRQANPNQPVGMAAGGLTSIPLGYGHDYAAGGIIGFADGGYTVPDALTTDAARAERMRQEKEYGLDKDPYEALRARYAAIEQMHRNEEADRPSRNVLSALAEMGSGPPRRFGESMATYAKSAINSEEAQRKLSEERAMKMADLQQGITDKERATQQGRYSADIGSVASREAERNKIRELIHAQENAAANTTSAGASAKQAQTAGEKLAADIKQFERTFPLDEAVKKAQAKQLAASAGYYSRPSEIAEKAAFAKNNPDLFKILYPSGENNAIKIAEDAWEKMDKMEKYRLIEAAGKDAAKAKQDFMKARQTNPYANKTDAEILAALNGLKVR